MKENKSALAVKTALEDVENSTLLIYGGWGVGKTYLWDQFVTNHVSPQKKPLAITCFGATTIAEIKNRICIELYKDLTKEDIKAISNTSSFFGNLFTFITTVNVKSKTDAVVDLSLKKIQDRILCIDDIERIHKDLDLIELFGLVEQLQFQSDATIVCIMNPDELEEKDKTTYLRMGEKIFDRSIRVSSPQKIYLEAESNITKESKIHLTECFKTLGIDNMRSTIRVERLVEQMIRQLKNKYHFSDQKLQNELISATVLFYCCKTHSTNSLPSIDFIKNIDDYMLGQRAAIRYDKNIKDDMEWYTVLDDYSGKWRRISPLDLQILQYLEYGYFDDYDMNVLVTAQRLRIDERTKTAEIGKAWDRYHSTFRDDTGILSQLYEASLDGLMYTDPSNLDSVIDILRSAGQTEQADNLIENYLDIIEKTSFSNLKLEHFYSFGPLEDKPFTTALKEHLKAKSKPLTLSQILKHRITESLTKEQQEKLISANKDEFYSALKELDTDATSIAAKTLAWLIDSEHRNCTKNEFKAALDKLGSESWLNRRRVKSVLKNVKS